MSDISKKEALERLQQRQRIAERSGAVPSELEKSPESALNARGLGAFSFLSGLVIFFMAMFVLSYVVTAIVSFMDLRYFASSISMILVLGLSMGVAVFGSRKLQPPFRKLSVSARWSVNVVLIVLSLAGVSQMIKFEQLT